MTRPIARDPIYRRRRFEAEIIELCVRWYITYRLSYRDLVAMMAERGLAVSHSTILRRENPRWKYVLVRNCPYLNNIVEQDHRAIKRRCASMLGFKSFGNAAITLAGIELAHR
ncbi:MAG: DDE-type integrase/transposase/recombinase, partial [Steroidobacteraceae bacterium]